MLHTFCTPWGQTETCEAIKATVLAMNGTVKTLTRGRLNAKWKTNGKKPGLFDTGCTFYVGDGAVRAVTEYKDPTPVVMEFRKLNKPLAFWNTFVETFTKRYPDQNFGIEAGMPKLVAIQFLGDGIEQVLVSNTVNRPSLSGAILGGMLFGTAGAIIGGVAGERYTITAMHTTNAKLRIARVRYSSGLVYQGKLINNGSLYQEIMVNMDRLSTFDEE